MDFLNGLHFWESIHMWQSSKDFYKDVAHTITVLYDSTIIVNNAPSRSMYVGSFMIDENFISTDDTIFDGVDGSSNDLSLDGYDFD